MFLKKIAFIGTLTLTGLPLIAHADLYTSNWTDKPSTVKIVTGSFQGCSSRLPGGITRPNEKNHHVPQVLINALCKGSPGNKCGADIYMNASCDDNDGVGVIDHATLDMTTGNVSLEHRFHPAYTVDQDSPTRINLRHK